MIGENLFISIG